MMSVLIWVTGLLLVAALAYYFYTSWNEKKGDAGDEGVKDLSEATIRDARKGDFVVVSGLADDYEDLNFEIVERNRYDSAAGSWYELKGVHGSNVVWLEWEEDDELIITATPSRQALRLAQAGLSEEDLIRMDEGESDDAFLQWEGKKYYYDFSGEAGFFRNGSGEGEGFYLWEFVSEDGTEQIAVEKWEGETFEVFHTRVIPPYNVTVFKKS